MKKSITKSLLISASVLTAIATSLPVVADTTSTPVADSSTGLISSVDNGSTATEPTKPVDNGSTISESTKPVDNGSTATQPTKPVDNGSTTTEPTKPVGSSSTIQSEQKAKKSNNKVSATEQAKAKADNNNVVDNTKPVKPTTEPTKPVDMTELPHTNDNNSVGLQAVGFLLTLFGLGGLVSLKKQKQ